MARYALDAGYTTIVEGILYTAHYGDMLTQLITDHAGRTLAYYMDIPWADTLARHATKPQATEYGATEMAGWWRERDFLPGAVERILTADLSADAAVDLIARQASHPASAAARAVDRNELNCVDGVL